MSRWLVGSSNSKTSGWTKRAHASATRIRQPPDSILVGEFFISAEKPSPVKMACALASAPAASMASRSWYTSSRLSLSSGVSSSICCSLSNSLCLSTSAATTVLSTVFSVPTTSCLT
mmetsp:Transcript_3975/g.7582  ORF Transcript_3975/g.7582 Transcript_3975/m.7582 type:complete len:117 (-) Transcript_3975:566-916(-)